MAKQKDELLDHLYDGIREYDNPLPAWWLWLFYGSIVFSVIYLPYYYFGLGPSSAEMYQQEVAMAPGTATAPAASGPTGGAPSGGAGASANAAMVGDPAAIAEGQGIYTANCLPCHGDKGQGVIGPNLTDNYWLHGNQFQDIVNVISNGVPDKGMIPWKSTLNPEKIGQVAAFVMSLHGTNPPNAKEPQGKEYPQ